MNDTGPPIELLTHRLADCPADFLLLPVTDWNGPAQIDVPAIACDLLRSLDAPLPTLDQMARLRDPVSVNRLTMIAVGTWLLMDDWFHGRPAIVKRVAPLLAVGLDGIAALVPAADVVNDADRREEFARICLRALGLLPQGESPEQAADRLTTLDSVGRKHVVEQTRRAEARARQLREKMAEEAAKAAAARYSPE